MIAAILTLSLGLSAPAPQEVPAAAGSVHDQTTPAGAVLARVRAFRDGDFLAYEEATIPPRYLPNFRDPPPEASPEEKKAPDEESAMFDRYLSMMIAESGEEEVFELLHPLAGKIGETLAFLTKPYRSGEMFGYSQRFALGGTEGGPFFDVVATWLEEVDFTDEERLREAIGIACETLRRTGIESIAFYGEADHLEGKRITSILFNGMLDILNLYGLDIRASLDSVKITEVEIERDLATVTLTYELLGKTRTATATLGQFEDGHWYELPAGVAFVTSAVIGHEDLPLCANVLVPASDYGLDESELRHLDVAADGVISSSGVKLWRPDAPGETAALIEELKSFANGMEREELGETSYPDGRLLIRAHREASPEVIRFLLRECRRDSVGIWRLQFACRSPLGDRGVLNAFAARWETAASETTADLDLVIRRSVETGQPTCSLRINVEPESIRDRNRLERAAATTDPAQLLELIKPTLGDEYTCRVCPEGDVPWGAVTEIVGEYLGEDVIYDSFFAGFPDLEWDDGFLFSNG